MVEISKKQRKISKTIVCEYRLLFNKEGYTISCLEYNSVENTADFCQVDSITSDKDCAWELFCTVAKYGVCACTLYDVICDLIC